jgi:V/A-type H+/Na+-transporting ATPase subunit I
VIARMKKVHLALLEREKGEGLEALRRLGAVHVMPVRGKGPDHERAERLLAEADRALAIASAVKAPRRAAAPAGPPVGEPAEAARRLIGLSDESQALREELAAALKDLERADGLGDYDPGEIERLRVDGIPLRVFECPPERLDAVSEDVSWIRLPAGANGARIAVVGDPGRGLPPEAVPVEIPPRGPAALRERVRGVTERLGDIEGELCPLSSAAPALKGERALREADLELETLRSGMESDGPVACLSGWIPERDLPRLRDEARRRAWALAAVDPAPDEMPPTKVENPGIVRIVDPLFEFLGTVPSYREYDISGWFLLFFGLFFAMIFGDGGYGLVMLAASAAALIRVRRSGKPVPQFLKLVLLLTGTTLAWGAATGSWFALPTERLPGFLHAIAVPAIMNGNPNADTNIKIFCFIIGAAQLALAHLKNIRRDFPDPRFIAQVGSLALVIGMFTAVLNLVVDSARFPIPGWALGLIGGGFLLVLVFGGWNGSLLGSIIEGLKGFIATFLGTVSVFADVVSYIRLWAVGLAGVAISQTVNGMVGGMTGGDGAAGPILAFLVRGLFGIVLLAVGHGLNLAMSVLSVLVHGVRLNMLEFSSHLGMEWSGYRYDPLRERAGAEAPARRETP